MTAQRSPGQRLGRAVSRLLIAPIRLYQRFVSPLRPPTCRYYPSCSAYAVEALQVHGPIKGLWLGVRRIGRCHPWTPGGVDHVPPAGTRSRRAQSQPSPLDPTTDAAPDESASHHSPGA
jgi:putative membrane protein insertion efficiency factor